MNVIDAQEKELSMKIDLKKTGRNGNDLIVSRYVLDLFHTSVLERANMKRLERNTGKEYWTEIRFYHCKISSARLLIGARGNTWCVTVPWRARTHRGV